MSIVRETVLYVVLFLLMAAGTIWIQQNGLPSFTDALSERLERAASQS